MKTHSENTYRHIFAILSCVSCLALAFADTEKEAKLIEKARLKSIAYSGSIFVKVEKEGVPVSGELGYPTPYILHNLGLASLTTQAQKDFFRPNSSFSVLYQSKGFREKHLNPKWDKSQLAKLKVLSIGEGKSGLVPFLRSQGVESYGLDIIYDDDEYKSDFYVQRFRKWLIAGDGTDMKKQKSESYDMVVSHALMSYLSDEQKKKLISESFRVLKKGGVMRHPAFISLQRAGLEKKEDFKKGLSLLVQGMVSDSLKGNYRMALVLGTSHYSVDPKSKVPLVKVFDTFSEEQLKDVTMERVTKAYADLSRVHFVVLTLIIQKIN